MMRITLKLFSGLMEYLPNSSDDNSVEIDQIAPISALEIMQKFNIPENEVRTMMLNGRFLPEDRHSDSLQDGDVLTVWPAIQGG